MVKSYGWWVGGCPLAHVNCVFVSAQSKKLGFGNFQTWSDLWVRTRDQNSFGSIRSLGCHCHNVCDSVCLAQTCQNLHLSIAVLSKVSALLFPL